MDYPYTLKEKVNKMMKLKKTIITIKAPDKKQKSTEEIKEKIEKLGLIVFEETRQKFEMNNQAVEEWLDKRTLQGEKMKKKEREYIDGLLFQRFLFGINDPDSHNYPYLGLFFDRFCDEKFVEYFEEQIMKEIYNLMNIKMMEKYF